ncbi:hypothetical protein Ahy_B04g070294 isoform P [Arachis hypogaea]|uniref:Uncharacterized protein n=1 Tax=Arachis hypogaea TaxID=3818 RepID=A0A444ZG84_ARAHY|nr:hypothetical protein Ahy_B04g070294 isoform P [Arachis hypogaea]
MVEVHIPITMSSETSSFCH